MMISLAVKREEIAIPHIEVDLSNLGKTTILEKLVILGVKQLPSWKMMWKSRSQLKTTGFPLNNGNQYLEMQF